MKVANQVGLGSVLGMLGTALLCLFWGGCATYEEPVFSEAPEFAVNNQVSFLSSTNGTNVTLPYTTSTPSTPRCGALQVGEMLVVNLSGVGSEPMAPHEERIKEDGSITMNLIGAVTAAGKTPGELQKLIHDLYVPKYYTRLTVTTKTPDRVYHVSGEVRRPGPQPHFGVVTVTKAIASAGDFTEWAKKSRVRITRADGETITANCDKILKNDAPDVEICPGDKVYVPRRFF